MQKPIQQISCVWVAADHTGHLKVKLLERRQFQQETAHRQVKPPVDSCLEVRKNFTVALGDDLFAERSAAGHVARNDVDPEWVADGFLPDRRELIVCRRDAAVLQQYANVILVKEQILCLQYGHQTRILECHQASGRRTAGQQHKAALGACPYQFTQGL